MTRKKKGRKTAKKILLYLAIFLLLIAAAGAFVLYRMILSPNINVGGKESVYLYIPTGSNFKRVCDSLYSHDLVKDKTTFEWLARFRKYPDKVKPGKYRVEKNCTNYELINMLRSGRQEPVKLIFNNIRTKEQLAHRIDEQLEPDSTDIIGLLNNGPYLETYGFVPENVLVMFLPNTYEFYWNTSAEQFIERMYKEYNKFWNTDRVDKASGMGLTPVDIAILASIVKSETTKTDEMSRIAGVYINRFNKNMLLQADPTVIYAWGDFSIKRLFGKHLAIDSPYNTYKYTGLPPGPINLPEGRIIDKVLDYEKHNYIYFCAKEDLSGYHAFAKTYDEHQANARRYQKALNKLNIR